MKIFRIRSNPNDIVLKTTNEPKSKEEILMISEINAFLFKCLVLTLLSWIENFEVQNIGLIQEKAAARTASS